MHPDLAQSLDALQETGQGLVGQSAKQVYAHHPAHLYDISGLCQYVHRRLPSTDVLAYWVFEGLHANMEPAKSQLVQTDQHLG